MNVEEFQEIVWQNGRKLYREMPWRKNTAPYYVLVSELMLQQTQVDRVIPKFNEFITAFPTVDVLAGASLAEVLTLWSGLGYNRRAKFLHEAAKKIVGDFEGKFPSTIEQLLMLPGVGKNTAGAIYAYSFNGPAIFVETNIRTVFFHHFFNDDEQVSDIQIIEKVSETLDTEHPREWYWALMDYGTYLKKQGVGRNSKSKHYKRQSPLKGSLREVRGLILKRLVQGKVSIEVLRSEMPADDRFETALSGLLSEGIVMSDSHYVYLPKE